MERMTVSIRKPIGIGLGRGSSTSWILLIALVVGIPFGMWGFVALLRGESQYVGYYVAAGWFTLLAMGYLGLRGSRAIAWTSVPALFTIRALIEFNLLPAWRFAVGDDLLDSTYVYSMFLSLIGFTAFWIGSLVFMREAALRFVPHTLNTPNRVAIMSAAMLGLGLSGNIVMWQAGLFSYAADAGLRESSVGFLQWLAFLGGLLNTALVVSAIEVLGKRSKEPLVKFVFWMSLIFSLLMGGLSGMKSQILAPLLTVAVVYGITRGRIPRVVFILPLSLLIIYPFVNAYRENLNNGYRSQVNTIGGALAVLEKTFDDVSQTRGSTSEEAGSGIDQTTARLSLLSSVHNIVGLPDPSLLNGDEKVWLAPIYPLIPRTLWKDKPVLNKGVRLSEAMGLPSTTSSAVTPIGDLYSMFGASGVAIGMLVYGISMQLYMNWAGRVQSESGMFIYISLLFNLINLEDYTVAIVAGAVQTTLVLIVLSRVIYGRSAPPGRSVLRPGL